VDLPITIGWGSTRDFNGKLLQTWYQQITPRVLLIDLLTHLTLNKEFIPAPRKKFLIGSEMNENQQRSSYFLFLIILVQVSTGGSGFNTITTSS
jgi:hypothetical protein